jgi:hypothetical protein
MALNLVEKAVGGDIQGHATVDGVVVRYNRATKNFVKGDPVNGIITMYKMEPRQYEKERRDDLANGGRV